MSLRDSGLVRENRGANGSMVWRVITADKMFQYTAPKHQNVQALATARMTACADLEKQMQAAGVTIADLIPSTDPRGVNLR